MRFIIDGYNLVHKIESLKKSEFPCRDLILFIQKNKLTGSPINQVFVFFDGHKPPYEIFSYNFKVVFSCEKSADECIIAKVKQEKNKKEILVITDDRQLGYLVKLEGGKPCRVDDFVTKKKKNIKTGKKEISYCDQKKITEEMAKIWLKEKGA